MLDGEIRIEDVDGVQVSKNFAEQIPLQADPPTPFAGHLVRLLLAQRGKLQATQTHPLAASAVLRRLVHTPSAGYHAAGGVRAVTVR